MTAHRLSSSAEFFVVMSGRFVIFKLTAGNIIKVLKTKYKIHLSALSILNRSKHYPKAYELSPGYYALSVH